MQRGLTEATHRVLAPRAVTILYNLLMSRPERRPWVLPANICHIVPVTFLKARVPFEFADISPQTLHINMDWALERAHTGQIGGLLYAHTYGEASTPTDFFAELKQVDESMLVIDDRCLCIPDLSSNVENPADVLLYSTGYAKIADLGFGGYAFLKEGVSYNSYSLEYRKQDLEALESDVKQKVMRRESFSYTDSAWLETDGSMPDWAEYQARVVEAVAMSLKRRREINSLYESMLPDEIRLSHEYQTWRFNIRVPNKLKILESIFAAGFFASSHYASLASIMMSGRCPAAEQLADEVVNLFNDHHYTLQMAEQTSHIIMEAINAC